LAVIFALSLFEDFYRYSKQKKLYESLQATANTALEPTPTAQRRTQ